MNKISLFTILSVFIFFSCSKSGGGGGNQTALPLLTTNNVTNARTDVGTIKFRFFVSLSNTYSSDVNVSYTTVPGTAVANTDFIPVSGTLTISSGQQSGYVDVSVLGDSTRKNNLKFYLIISNPVNATISGTDTAYGTIQCVGTYFPVDTTSVTGGYLSPSSYPGYNMVWSDEFSGKTLNPANWIYEIGNNGGWGNGELEYYTNSTNNIFLSSGCLVIEARNEVYAASNYTSARIKTDGLQSFQYGRIDIRAKLPVGSGIWPALWMLGSNYSTSGWPLCGENDIMELKGGTNPSQIFGSLHWKNNDNTEGTMTNMSSSISPSDFSQQFHVFSLIWKQNYVQFLVDNNPYATATQSIVTNGTWPFNAPQFFIFNVAVGGNFPSPVVASVFPQRMIVDYVRVFQ